MYSSCTTTPLSVQRYRNINIDLLVNHLQVQSQNYQSQKRIDTRKSRRNHQSCSQILQSYKQKQKQLFNNKTCKQSNKLFDSRNRSLPYKYIPKYKNQSFILPDRAFAKGKAAKRFHIKMKDSCIYSFKDNQDIKINKLLNKTQKQKIIISRQLQQYQKIVNENDGRLKAKQNRWILYNTKHFRHISNGTQLFNKIQPVLQTNQSQTMQLKKMSLTKSHINQNKWKIATKTQSRLFSATTDNGFFTQINNYTSKSFKNSKNNSKIYHDQ